MRPLLRRTPFFLPAAVVFLFLAGIPALADPIISEIRIDNPGYDTDEYFELMGSPFESLDGLTYIVLGDTAAPRWSGVIESVTPLDGLALDANGFIAIVANPSLATCTGYSSHAPLNQVFENSDNVTHMLVRDFFGSLGEDLDGDEDGVLDYQPWAEVLDCVALIERTDSGEHVYCETQVGPDRKHTLPIGKAREYVPAHVARCGTDWYIGNLYQDPPCGNDSPGMPNTVCASFPPRIPTLISRPCAAGPDTPLTFEAIVMDPDGNLSTVVLNYRIAGQPSYTSVPMTPSGSSEWSATIDPQNDQTLLEFFVEAADADSNVTRNPSTSPLHPRTCRVGLQSIPEIQTSTVPVNPCPYPSDLDGQAVNVTGIVTHVAGEFSSHYFYIQQGTEPYSGLKIYVPNGGFSPGIGDSVVVSGIVEEFRCQTQVRLFTGCGQVVGSAPFSYRALSGAGEIDLEENESMLVSVAGPVSVLRGWDTKWVRNGRDPVFGLRWFTVWARGDSAQIGDDTFYPDGSGFTLDPQVGQTMPWIRGIVAVRSLYFGDPTLRIQPRRDPDVTLDGGTDVPRNGEPVVVEALRLDPARPSPTRAVTTIGFAVPAAGRMTLRVYDVSGSLVRELVARDYDGPAIGETVWDGRDKVGRPVAAGVYFYRLELGEHSATRKIMLLR